MLTGIHILLTYACNYECDHCFLYCGPKAPGTFTISQIKELLSEAGKIETVNSVFVEGGEPFLYFPLMAETLKLADNMGFSTGIVTNCYWAASVDDAKLWLESIAGSGIVNLSLSDDKFHHGESEQNPARIAAQAAKDLKIPASLICIEEPVLEKQDGDKGEPVIGGGALFKGRAVETMVKDLPGKPPESFCECTHEELVKPRRVHVDPFGNVFVCQGLSMGNMWEKPLSEIVLEYDASTHPICAPLSKGGPFELAKTYGIELNGEFVDECHYCFLVRKLLMEKFPEFLAPKQVYGLTP